MIKFDIVQKIGKLGSPNKDGWTKELNIVRWNGGKAKVDVRYWSEDHDEMSKGITLAFEEADKFAELWAAADIDRNIPTISEDPGEF